MNDPVGPGETLDLLCRGRVRLIQKKQGYRFSMDPILLANFVRLKKHERLLDIGTGCGIIPVYLATRGCENPLWGIEIQEELFSLAVRNKELNRCENIEVVRGDIRSGAGTLKKQFHVIVSNPPYVREGTGRESPKASRRVARQDSFLDLETLLSAASSLLFKKGRLYLIYPTRRLAEVIFLARSQRLEPKRIRLVQAREGEESNLFLMECIKEGGSNVKVEKPLIIYEGDNYSEEVKGYYA
jgi:tRNA1Val (adenine37-N6)-methyltransferase